MHSTYRGEGLHQHISILIVVLCRAYRGIGRFLILLYLSIRFKIETSNHGLH